MNDYVEARFDISPCDETSTDLLAALLCEKGYESFVPDETGLTAYVKQELFDADAFKEVVNDFPMEAVIDVKQGLECRVGEKLFPTYSGRRRVCDPQLIPQGYPVDALRYSDRSQNGIRHRTPSDHIAHHTPPAATAP